jgi:CubicO group peptidase (beta-lactamase class C family)
MSRAVWRAAFGTLRGKQRLAFYYLFAAYYTAQCVGDSYRNHIGPGYVLFVAVVAFMWPLAARMAGAPRELLRLPLSTRDVGTVLFLLRVVAPCVCVLLMTPLIAPIFARTPYSLREQLALASGLCAAFPLLSLAPFLPLPRGWREPGVTREECRPRLRWLAGVAIWLLAPALAVLPLASKRNGIALWPWLSLAIGSGLATLFWMQRERLARASFSGHPDDAHSPERENGARWHGWSGFVPLFSPIVATCCLLGLATGLFFTLSLLPGAATAMEITLVSLSASLSAKYISNCARVLRLLPLSPARLSVILLAMLVLPTLAGSLLGATLAHALHPDRLSIAHVAVFCLLSLTCNVVVFVPALRAGRLKSIGPLFAASAVLQFACALAATHFGIPVPPEDWLFAACGAVLVLCLAWLNTSLKFYRARAIAAIAIMALACLPVFAAEPPDPAHYAAGAEALIKRYVDDGRFSGAVLVAVHGKPVLREGFGLANREWNIAVTPETEFRIGSMTKQFTATAILQLAERGKLALSDPIAKYYAAAPKAWNSVTIAQLLSHRSGIPNFTELPGFADGIARRDLSPEQVIALTRDAPLHFAPGSQYEYSNSGYALLGYVIEKQSGQPYADYLREHVFHPLGMEHTGYDVSADILPRRASGYSREKDVWKNASFTSMSVPYAAGALYSTVDDLLIWDQALAAAKPLSRASLESMFTDHGSHYGYGYVIDEDAGHRREWHNGGINGFTAYMARYPADDLTVIVLANLEGAPVNSIGKELAHSHFGAPAGSASTSAPHPGTETALRQVITELAAGTVDFTRIGPELAVHLKPQVGATQALLAQCGALESVTFSGSTEHGWDTYTVRFQNTTLEWRIVLGPDGKITGLRLSPP